MRPTHLPLVLVLLSGVCCNGSALRPGSGVAADVLPEYHNRQVTALTEDCESVRLALGAAWDDALACRACSGYLHGWTAEDGHDQAEAMARRGTRVFEKLYCVDHGIQGVRFARDTRDEPALEGEVRFWRNELALAAKDVLAYAADAAALKATLAGKLVAAAAGKGITSRRIAGMPWAEADREAWRKAGAQTGVRLPLDPDPCSPAAWWRKDLSLEPGYPVSKLLAAGDTFFSPEKLIGAWGHNCTAPGQYDWTAFNGCIRMVKDRGGRFLLELPTLHQTLPAGQAVMKKQESWIWTLYAPPLPPHLAGTGAALTALGKDGKPRPWGGVQLFDPATAKAYGEYLAAMAAELRRQGLYDAVAAVHLETGDSAELSEDVDCSEYTAARWRVFMKERHVNVEFVNRVAGTDYKSYDDLPIPVRGLVPVVNDFLLPPRAAGDWKAFTGQQWRRWLGQKYKNAQAMNKAAGTAYKTWEDVPADGKGLAGTLAADWQEFSDAPPNANEWGNYLMTRYRPAEPGTKDDQEIRRRTLQAVRRALGDDYQDGYQWRLPLDYPSVIKIDYLHFRRAWVREYLGIKRRLVAAAFPDKLIIAEMRQMGDHDGIAGKGERKWGGFLGDDMAQFSGVGPANDRMPFMIRSVGPPGFGTRVSDADESLLRDYLWINFRDPGNLLRYFYAWVAHGYLDYQLGWQGITNHWMTNRLIHQLGPTVVNTAPRVERIGLLLPRATFDLFDGTIYYEYLGWDWLLHAAKLPYTRIDEHFVREGGLERLGLRVLILPDAWAMDTKLAEEIGLWVAAGGTLVCSTIPGKLDEYGRAAKDGTSALAAVLGVRQDGTVSQAVKDTPLTVTIPRGVYAGGLAESTARVAAFEALLPAEGTAVLAAYEGGKPAITSHPHGKGRAVVMGYPFGREAVEAERTSLGFYRTYTSFLREPQLVARTAWLRKFITQDLGFRPDFGVEFAEVQRPKGKEAWAMNLCLPKGFSQDPADWFYVATVGDPRPGHEMVLDREDPDMAIRFYPRRRAGLATTYLGISTREVHYISPRGDVDILLSRRTYRVRINNPKIQAVWDVARDVPVGFQKDAVGVSFTVSLPSGHQMMLAYSETPQVELFAPERFPGRDKDDLLARCRDLAGGTTPPAVVILNAPEIKAWLEGLAKPPGIVKTPPKKPEILVSYGDAANKPAAEKLVAFLRAQYNLDARAVEQAATAQREKSNDATVKGYEDPVIFLGNEWTNNDLALNESYWNWGNTYGGHLPFTSTYAWPGPGRSVVALSRRYALIDPAGHQVGGGNWNSTFTIRPVRDEFKVVRQKLYIAADGRDADAAVEEIMKAMWR